MTILQMLGQSVILTLLGMGVVFSFLIILIVSMNILNSVLHALKMDEDAPSALPSAQAQRQSPSVDNGAVVAAIAAAAREKNI